MSWVYRRPPQSQFRQKRKLTPTLFTDPPVGGWASTSGDLLFSLMDAASEHELYNVESVTSGETTWTHDGTVRQIEVLLMHLNFIQTVLLDNVSTADKIVRLPQEPDNVYSNP